MVAKVSAANIFPFPVAPNLEGEEKEELREQYQEQVDSQTVQDILNQGDNQILEMEIKLEPLSPEKEKLPFERIDLTGISQWEPAEQEEVRELFREYGRLFALDDLDLGHTSVVKHKIKLNDYTPFKERYRRIPPHQYDEVRRHLKEMLEIWAIRKSNSPWVSAVVLVRKKDGSLRFCIDLHKLNVRTIKDAYSLPRIDETLDFLGGSVIFTSLDLKSGYWQVEMDEMSKQLTAFTVGPLGFYECERMPFGLTNAPATFQRLMESCLGDLHLNWCIIYLDDIIVFSQMPKEHIKRLRGVFSKLVQAGLKLKPKKCEFFKSRISYLGHIVSSSGIETDPRKVEAVKTWAIPKTVTDVRSFLGFTNYYRRFIKDYAKVARPLNALISGENASKKNRLIEWSNDCQKAFDELKKLCTSAPVLAYANYKKEFQLHTDASELGLGGVLYQKDDQGNQRVIAYASWSLTQTERNYPAHKLEFLALKWAVMDRFHEYLYGGKFNVYTDNNPLTYILTSAKLDAGGQRWVASLASYDFGLFYKTGKMNMDADALSHIPRNGYHELESPVVKVLLKSSQGTDWTDFNGNPSKIVCKSCQMILDRMTTEHWKKEQANDEIISQVVKAMENSSENHAFSSELARQMFRHRNKLIKRHGLLYKKFFDINVQEERMQFVLPRRYWS